MSYNYYLYVSPSVFIWYDKQHILFFNSDTNVHNYYPSDENALKIVRMLQNPINLYCIPIDIDRYRHLVDYIENKGIGKTIRCIETEQPIAIPPKLYFSKKVNKTNYFDIHSIDYIKTITIHLSCGCSFNCKNCDKLLLKSY